MSEVGCAAASVALGERQQCADQRHRFHRHLVQCCAASDGGEEPTLPDAASGTNVYCLGADEKARQLQTMFIARVRDAMCASELMIAKAHIELHRTLSIL